MPRRCDSSIDSGTGSESDVDSNDANRRILVKKIAPTILGINLTFILHMTYFLTLFIAVFHCVVVLGTSFVIGRGYIMTIMFGILSPITLVYWAVTLIYAWFGTRVLFLRQNDYWLAASYFRRWTRITRYLLVCCAAALLHFLLAAFMFVYAVSLGYHFGEYIRLNKIVGAKRSALNLYAGLHDDLILSQVQMHYPFPLDFVTMCGVRWGSMAPLVIVLPLLIVSLGMYTQFKYYNWRYAHTGIRID